MELETNYVFGLKALWSLLHFEFNRLPFVEGLVPFGLNRRKVHENILARLALNEPITLCCVKPLHCTLLSAHWETAPTLFIRWHLTTSKAICRLPGLPICHKKRPSDGCPAAFSESCQKRNLGATNAHRLYHILPLFAMPSRNGAALSSTARIAARSFVCMRLHCLPLRAVANTASPPLQLEFGPYPNRTAAPSYRQSCRWSRCR